MVATKRVATRLEGRRQAKGWRGCLCNTFWMGTPILLAMVRVLNILEEEGVLPSWPREHTSSPPIAVTKPTTGLEKRRSGSRPPIPIRDDSGHHLSKPLVSQAHALLTEQPADGRLNTRSQQNDMEQLGMTLLHQLSSKNFETVQHALNKLSATSHSMYASHRAHMMTHLTQLHQAAGGGGSSLIVAGSGNVNDVDLKTLLKVYNRIRLLDVDTVASHAGIQRQHLSAQDEERISVEYVELSGGQLAGPSMSHAWEEEMDEGMRLAVLSPNAAVIKPTADASVAVSACVFTQMVLSLKHKLRSQSTGESDAAPATFNQAVHRLRRMHLHSLVQAVRPGGWVLFVTDMIEARDFPFNMPAAHVNARVDRTILKEVEERSFTKLFPGTSPSSVLKELEAMPDVQMGSAEVVDAWRWSMSQSREYLVYAIRAQRKT